MMEKQYIPKCLSFSGKFIEKEIYTLAKLGLMFSIMMSNIYCSHLFIHLNELQANMTLVLAFTFLDYDNPISLLAFQISQCEFIKRDCSK